MYWSVGAVLLQAMGWAVSYTLLAKAKPSVFFINELISTIWSLPIKLICYKYWGLTGFGMATLICYLLYLIQVLFVAKRLFGISYSSSLWKIFVLLHFPVIVTVALKLSMPSTWGYVLGSVILVTSSVLALFQLNRRMDLLAVVRNRINRTRRNEE
jgi:hypothetical protein